MSNSPSKTMKRSSLSLLVINLLLVGMALVACTATHVRAQKPHQLERVVQRPSPTTALRIISAVRLDTVGPSGCPLYMVSLQQAEREVKKALAHGRVTGEPLPLGGLTKLVGYRWDPVRNDLQLIGEICANSPVLILADQFVEALQRGHYEAVGMTLIPKDPTRSDSVHLVHAFPADLADTHFLASLIPGDYKAKELALGVKPSVKDVATRYHDEIKRCQVSTASSRGITPARIFFLPVEPVLEVERTGEGFTRWIRKADIILQPERDVIAASGQVTSSSLPPDPALSDFAEEFTRRFTELEREFPAFQQLHTMYEVFLVAQLLHAEQLAEQLPYDLSFWLSEYPLKRYPTPRELPGFKPKRIKHTCWGRPYTNTEYSGLRVERQVWGGVIIGYQHFPAFWHGRGLQPPANIGASVSVTGNSTTLPAPTLPGLLPGQ